jgi:peptide chain release factor 1
MEKELHFTKKDFRVDTFRSGGNGGQHQNTTDSGVRITHIETGISAESRQFKSQYQNKEMAFKLLAKRLLAFYATNARERYQAGTRIIRTYNQPGDFVVDMQTKKKYPFKQTVGKNDLSEVIEDRRLTLLDEESL